MSGRAQNDKEQEFKRTGYNRTVVTEDSLYKDSSGRGKSTI